MNSRMTCLLAALFAVALASPVRAADFKLVIHPDNPVDSLPRDLVSKLFLKKTTSWPDGKVAAPVDQSDGPVREAFTRAVHKKSVSAVKSHWQQQIFSGRAIPPLEKRDDAQVVAFVESNPQAIGYLSAEAATGKLKVLEITP